MKNRMFSLLFIFLVSPLSQALEVRENYNGVRSLGMGGAQVAVVNDETALLANPAALGKLRDSYGTYFDPECEAGSRLPSMYDKSPFTDPFDLPSIKDTTNTSRGVPYHAKCQVFPSFVLRNFGVGINYSKTLDAKMSADGSSLQTYFRDDMAVHLGISLKFFEGRFKIGAMGKMVSRIEISSALDPTGTMDVSRLASEGVGIGGDIGVMMTAPVVLLPTLSIVARDVGGTAFTGGSGVRMTTATRPESIGQDYDLGLAIFPIHGNMTRSTFTIEVQKAIEMGRAVDKKRYYHLGYEFNYGDLFFLRAGMNQQYWTAGIELASERYQIQLASYGEDIGADGTPEEDRRYIVKLAFRF